MKSLPPILAALVIVLLLICGYVGAYLGMAQREYHHGPHLMRIDRSYGNKWMPAIFWPAAWLESQLRGVKVRAVYRPPGSTDKISQARPSVRCTPPSTIYDHLARRRIVAPSPAA